MCYISHTDCAFIHSMSVLKNNCTDLVPSCNTDMDHKSVPWVVKRGNVASSVAASDSSVKNNFWHSFRIWCPENRFVTLSQHTKFCHWTINGLLCLSCCKCLNLLLTVHKCNILTRDLYVGYVLFHMHSSFQVGAQNSENVFSFILLQSNIAPEML